MRPLIVLYLFLPFFAFAGGNENGFGDIKGTVLTTDNKPASNVTIEIKNTGKGTVTDDNGNFSLKKIEAGACILSISLMGYYDHEVSVDIKENEIININIQLKVSYVELMKVIVTANPESKYLETKPSESLRLNLPFLEIPQNIQVTTRQAFAEHGLLSMSEAIRTVSSIEKNNGNLNDYSLIIRGTDARYNVFRNGIGGYWWNQQEDIAMLEKIEFIKGPAGFMISMAEPGGLINNITKQPQKEPVANINIGIGSYHQLRLTADLGGKINKSGKFYYRLNMGIHDQQRAFQFGKAFRYFVCAATRYEPNEKTALILEYNYMHGKTSGNNDDVPSINGKLYVLPNNFAVSDAHSDRIEATDKYYRIQLTHLFNNNWHLNAQLGYVHGSWIAHTLNSTSDFPVSNDTLYRFFTYDDWRNFSSVAQMFIDKKFQTGKKMEHSFLAGFDYANSGIKDAVSTTAGEKKFGINISNPEYFINPDSLKDLQIDPEVKWHWEWISLYLQDHIKISGKLILTLATHLTHAFFILHNPDFPDYQNGTNYNVWIPRIGLTWLFSDNVSIYALYDQSFFPQAGKSIKQKPFKPLTGYNIETGLKSYFFNRKLSLNLSIYNIVKNHTLCEDPVNVGYEIERGQVITRGIDLDLTGNITTALTTNFNYAYTNAKITKDDDASLIGMKNFGTPDHSGNCWLRYKLLRGILKGFSFATGYQYMGKRSADIDNTSSGKSRFLPAYNLFDAAVSYNNKKFNVGLNVYNITNIDYAIAGYFNSATNEWRYTPGEPVNYRLSLSVNLQHKKNK